MKRNTTTSLALKIITDDYSTEYEKMCERIQYAIEHNAACLYMENEGESVIFHDTCMKDLYPQCTKDDPNYIEDFLGWVDFKRIIIVYFDRAPDVIRTELLIKYFSSNMLAEYFSPENTNWFDGPEAMAIRVEQDGGSWFEHIISWTKPRIKNGRVVSKR